MDPQDIEENIGGLGDMDASASESLDRVHRLRRRGSGRRIEGRGAASNGVIP